MCECIKDFGKCLKVSTECTQEEEDLYEDLCISYQCSCDSDGFSEIVLFSLVSFIARLLSYIQLFGVAAVFLGSWLAVAVYVKHLRRNGASDEDSGLLSEGQTPPVLVPIPENLYTVNIDGVMHKEQENKENSQHPENSNILQDPELKGVCKVCMDNKIDTVFVPCGHRVVCVSCSTHLTTCCLCRKDINIIVKTWDT